MAAVARIPSLPSRQLCVQQAPSNPDRRPRPHAFTPRYFCPNLGIGGYPKWAPHAVAEGACTSRTREEMVAGRAPLPPDFKVLFYGNSYVRQVMGLI